MSAPSDEDKISTVRVFHDQVMSAVLDGRELIFFDLIESFFGKREETTYKAGYMKGWEDAMLFAANLIDTESGRG